MGCDSQFDDPRDVVQCAPSKTLVKDRGPRVDTSRLDISGLSVEKVEQLQETRPPLSEFEQKLRSLINAQSMENHSGTPDFILAEYMVAALNAFTVATRQREHWYMEYILETMNDSINHSTLIPHRD